MQPHQLQTQLFAIVFSTIGKDLSSTDPSLTLGEIGIESRELRELEAAIWKNLACAVDLNVSMSINAAYTTIFRLLDAQ